MLDNPAAFIKDNNQCTQSIYSTDIVNDNAHTLDDLKKIKNHNERISHHLKSVDVPSAIGGDERLACINICILYLDSSVKLLSFHTICDPVLKFNKLKY